MAYYSTSANRSALEDSEYVRPENPRYREPFYRFGKRLFDILIAAIGLLVLFPIFLIVAIAIVVSDGFPVIFRQKRLGEGGKEFSIYKFRSMRRDAEAILKSRPDLMEEYQRTFKIANDPRLLKIGPFIRSTSIDELPQLINVLLGSMSIVGPRPIVPREIEKYGKFSDIYFAMKPGCAGLWQSSGRSDLSYDERVGLDLEYYKTASLRRDAMVLWQTFKSIIRRKGAF